MDKYELSIKEDKIKKHAEKKDYATAAKIADTIDWSKVRNIKMLTLVSQIYEKVKNYTEAKNVLLLAYERVPVGRRMLYKLSELCIKAGDLDEAEEFFEEFQEIAPNDISKLILAYQIEAARGEPLDKLITILELYRKNEFEEKWAYELAYLYHKAGRSKDCVQLCNEIILWFSVGPYVDKALNLKMQYEPLTPAQQEKLVNKKKFEERIKAVEREFEEKYSQEAVDAQGNVQEPTLEEEGLREAAVSGEPTEEVMMDEPGVPFPDTELHDMEADLAQAIRAAAEDGVPEEPENQRTKELPDQAVSEESLGQTKEFLNEVSAALAASVGGDEAEEAALEPEVQEEAPEETLEESGNGVYEEEAEMSVPEAEPEEAPAPAEEEAPEEEPEAEAPAPAESEDLGQTKEFLNEVSAALAASVDQAVSEAVPEKEAEAIVKMPVPSSAVKKAPVPRTEPKQEMPAAKKESVRESRPAGHAEAPAKKAEPHKITCVVIDEPAGPGRIALAVEKLKKTHEVLGTPVGQVAKISGEKLNSKGLHNTFAKLGGRDLIVDNAADLDKRTAQELVAEIRNPMASMVLLLVDAPERMDVLLGDNPELDILCVYLEDDSQMSVDDFVDCAKAYAQEEECVIDEMAGLALYAAAERMRNDGIRLSEDAAKDLIDDVIEKAEHRGIKGLFGSKYDKKGYLILKEQFFKSI